MAGLVGREDDLVELLALLGVPMSAVVVVGEAGVGKTALVSRAIATCRHREGGALGTLSWMPYLALRRALPELPVETWGGDPAHVVGQVRQALGGQLLLVEDAHWCDPATVDCLAELVGAQPMVVTVRQGDPGAAVVLSRLEKAGAVGLRLGSLAAEHARELVRRIDPELDGPAVDALLTRSGGNPLLLQELARAGEVTPTLRLAMLARCRALPSDVVDDLALLSLAGQPLDVEHLPRASDLVDAGLVAVGPGGRATVRHALIGEVVVELLSADRRRRCHQALASLLDHPGAVARHLLAAGERARARDAALRAVEESLTPGERWRHLVTAAEASDGDESVLLRARAAEAACTGGEPDEAARLLDGVEPSGPHDVEVLLARATQAFQAGEWDRYLAEIQTATGRVVPGSTGEAMVRARQATAALIVENDAAAGLRLAREAVDLAERAGASSAGARSTAAAAMAALDEPGWEAEFTSAIAAAREEGDHYRELNARHNFSFALTAAGRLDESWDRAGEQLDRCHDLRLLKRARSAEVTRLVVASYRGDLTWAADEAGRLLSGGLAPADEGDLRVVRGTVLAQLGRTEAAIETVLPLAARSSYVGNHHGVRLLALALGGQPHQALAEWAPFRDALGHDDVELVDTLRAATWAAWEAGVEPPARVDGVTSTGLLAGADIELDAWSTLVAGDPAAAAPQFGRAAELHGPRAWDRLWCGWAAGEAARLAGDAAASHGLTEVLDAAQERGYDPIANRCRRSLRAMGERARSGRVRAADDPLTPREREVVGLVAEGLTDLQIAARLGVAHRTVQTQVASARRKLGADSRAHLAALAEGGS